MKSKGGGQEWYYHAPSSHTKSEKQLAPPASQIPGLAAGLSDLDQEAMDREANQGKHYIRDTDSHYIKLAKQGGRKNLLAFTTKPKTSTEPKAYPRVEWFDHNAMTTEEEKEILARQDWHAPEYMVHLSTAEKTPPAQVIPIEDAGWARQEGKSIRRKYEQRAVPFHTDVDDVDLGQASLPQPPAESAGDKKRVAFDKLLSGGYGTEWFSKAQTAVRQKQLKKWEQTRTKAAAAGLTEYQESIAKRELPKTKLKPIVYKTKQATHGGANLPFKLNKFNKIKAKVATSRA